MLDHLQPRPLRIGLLDFGDGRDFLSQPLAPVQRQFRDAHAVNSHLAFNFDAAGTNYGRVALGLPSENLTL